MAAPTFRPVPPVPRIALPNPHFRKPSLSTHIADDDSVRNSTLDAAFPVPSIPRELLRKDSVCSDIGQAVTGYSPIDSPPRVSTPSSIAQKYTPRSTTKLHHASPQLKSNDSGYLSTSSPETSKSPVVPIRSMFPVYNPSVSLQKQQYVPQISRPIRRNSSASRFTSHDFPISSLTPIDRVLGTPPRPKSAMTFQLETMNHHVSTQKELTELWEATHGMEPNPRIKSYDLELARTEEATFTLGASPAIPFYSMITYDTNEIALSKICPRKQALKCEVSVNSIEPPTRRSPPNDGLVTFIFPKMAAMLAINQSTALAQEHGLAPTHRDEVQAAAVKRAASQEACRLRWNAAAQHYELEHPAVGRRTRTPEFSKSPESAYPKAPDIRPILEIHVSVPVGRSLPVISIPNPRASDLESSAPSISGIRMSTIPQLESNESLIALDFNTRTMRINANKILEHVPSLFAVDSLVSAIMTVAIADAVTNPVMGALEIWQPKPQRAMSEFGGSVAAKSTVGSVLYATLAEREDAEAEARELADLHERDIRNKERRKQHKKWFGKSKSEKPVTRKVLMKEFDLEKLGQYQSGDRQGQQLPGVVRTLMSVMVGGLRLIVWFLTAIVRLLVWILANSTRCFTSSKF